MPALQSPMQLAGRLVFLILLTNLLQSCLLINYASQETSLIWLLLPGFGLLYVFLPKIWKHAGKVEVPAWLRFLHGLSVSIMIFIA